ncbi:unnamed protein product [Mytilus coruscus]|uniref:Uncharacterized protein n=1 Tax=Mytilus coruscus TaxID=42192 RepID=A0A6J8BJN5_MYTCO|nr:unnamed protein product [Mytilus coruscus]
MASSLPVISREEINFLRIANLLIRHSPKAVRILFNREFNPSGLTSVLSKNRNKLDKLKKKNVITQTQWSLLFPSGSVPDSSNFDLTLMVCLLRNLTKITIQDMLPQLSDLSKGAAVSRIKFYRNQIAHFDSGAMSDSEFSKTFDEVSMDQLWYVESKDSIGYSNGRNLRLEKKLEKFYVTEAATRLIEVVKNNQCTIITGVPGSGKSSLAYYVAIHMQETDGYTVLPIWSSSELMANSNVKQVYVFDDVFGTYSLIESNLNYWDSETRRIKVLLKNKVLKVMVTCRSYLYDKVRDSLSSQSFKHFNMQSDVIHLSLEERKEIGKLYITDSVNMDNADFFQNPNQFIENEIRNFKSKRDLSFIGLALLVLSNNSIKKDSLQIGKDKYDIILQDLLDELDIRKCPSKTSILLNLQHLKNMYLEETESTFCTKHDKMFDIITHSVGKFIIRCILRHCESAFISSRCQLKSLNERHGDCTVMIEDELETLYFDRILEDIDKEHNWEVFAGIQMKLKNTEIC